MSKLYFENERKERELVGQPANEEECMSMIYAFCEERNFNIPYVRTWITPTMEKYYDVSSHSEFFVRTIW